MNIKMEIKMRTLAPKVLRVGIGIVFIWFGFQQIADPSYWVSYLPLFTENLPIRQTILIYLNGTFELIFGTLLITAIYARIVAFFLALHLLGIILTVGYNEIGVRDFGLLISLVSIFFQGKNDEGEHP